MLKLNVGCGPNLFPGWVNYDREDQGAYIDYLEKVNPTALPPQQRRLAERVRGGEKVDFRIYDLRKGFPQYGNRTVDLIYLGQVIEHLNPIFEAAPLLMEFHRILKVGGVLRIATPDLVRLLTAYQEGRMDDFTAEQPDFYKGADQGNQLSFIMFGAAGPKSTSDHYEGHMHLYTPSSIRILLRETKFLGVEFVQPGQSSVPGMDVVDTGTTHSLFVEATK